MRDARQHIGSWTGPQTLYSRLGIILNRSFDRTLDAVKDAQDTVQDCGR